MTLKQKFQNEIETESTASLNMGDVLSWGVLIFGEGQPPGIPKPETDQSIARLGSRIPDQAWALEHKGWQRMMKKSNSHCRRFTLTPYFGGLQLELASDSRHVTKRVLHPYIGPCKKSSSEHLRDDSFAYLSR